MKTRIVTDPDIFRLVISGKLTEFYFVENTVEIDLDKAVNDYLREIMDTTTPYKDRKPYRPFSEFLLEQMEKQ